MNDETNCLTRPLNCAPITTATASWTRFPRMMKFLNPLMPADFPIRPKYSACPITFLRRSQAFAQDVLTFRMSATAQDEDLRDELAGREQLADSPTLLVGGPQLRRPAEAPVQLALHRLDAVPPVRWWSAHTVGVGSRKHCEPGPADQRIQVVLVREVVALGRVVKREPD